MRPVLLAVLLLLPAAALARDRDGDGLRDDIDACPREPGPPGGERPGCPVPAPPAPIAPPDGAPPEDPAVAPPPEAAALPPSGACKGVLVALNAPDTRAPAVVFACEGHPPAVFALPPSHYLPRDMPRPGTPGVLAWTHRKRDDARQWSSLTVGWGQQITPAGMLDGVL